MSNASRDARGMSLVELLIVCGLMGLLGTMFMWLMLPSMRISGQQSARVEIQQQAVLAVNRIAQAVSATTAAGLSQRDTNPVSTGVVPLTNVDSQGRQVWATNMTLFYWDTSDDRLYEKTWEASFTAPKLSLTPGRPVQATSGQLATMVASSQGSGSRRSLAHGVANYTLTPKGGGPETTMPVNITLILQRKTPQRDDLETFAASRVITTRQSR